MGKVKNRWLIAAAAVSIHLSIGSVYAWSVFTGPLLEQLNWDLADVQFTFSLAIFCLGIAAAFLGKFMEKIGPRKAGILSAVFFGLGLAGSGLAIQMESLYLLYLFYGIFGGIGLGIGYVAPVSTLIKWFPDKRGMATGMAVMGFGFAALICSPIIVSLIPLVGLPGTFYILGIAYFLIIFAASLHLSPPPTSWAPAGVKLPEENNDIAGESFGGRTAFQALRTKSFWYLWIMFFINISCGIAIISVASPMAMEYAGISAVAAATMVGVMGLFNGAGRIGWATVSDKIGRPAIFSIFFGLQMLTFFLLPGITNALLFQIFIFLIISCYGGGFATMPAYLSDLFGTKELGVILGYILTAWAVAGMAGPLFAAWTRSISSSYDETLYFFAGLLLVGFLLSFLIKKENKKLRKRIAGEVVDLTGKNGK